MIFGNAVSERQENTVVSEANNDRHFTVGTSSNNMATNESTVNVKTLERCFNECIEKEISSIVDRVEDRIQNAFLIAIDNIVAPKIELAIRSISASSGRDVTSVYANSEDGEHVGINASFENASGNNDILHASNVNDETRHKITDEVSELSVPETHFDRQAHTHHRTKSSFNECMSFKWTITSLFVIFHSLQVCIIITTLLLSKFNPWLFFNLGQD